MASPDLDPDDDPSGSDEFRCAPWTASRGVDPIGSATPMDRLVLVEVPGPWPNDVADLAWFADAEPTSGTRIHAVTAEVGRPDGSVLVTRWERSGARFVGVEWAVPATEVTEVVAVIAGGGEPGRPGTPAEPELLVCAHGRRDRCCGSFGTRLAIEARAALAPHRVRRVSHLGGHRYAPTALTMPDGRFWAYLDVDILTGIVQRNANPGDAREFYRGNCALDGWAQTVEATVLTARGWDGFDLDAVSATTTIADDEQSAEVALTITAGGVDETLSATVEIAERYPVLQCGLPPSDAKKSAPAYRLAGEVRGR